MIARLWALVSKCVIVIWKSLIIRKKREINSWSWGMATYLDWLTSRLPRLDMGSCLSLLPYKRGGFVHSWVSLQKSINALERNPRDLWDDWGRDDLELTLEMMEQLPSFILHPCIDQELGFERWFQEMRGESSWTHHGDEDGDDLDAWEMVVLFIFSFLSLVQLILPLVERGRGMEIWVGKRVRVRIVVCWGYGWVKDIWYALWLNILVEDVFRYRYEGIYIFSKNEMKIVVSAKYTFCHICNKLAQQPQSIADTHRRAVIFHQ